MNVIAYAESIRRKIGEIFSVLNLLQRALQNNLPNFYALNNLISLISVCQLQCLVYIGLKHPTLLSHIYNIFGIPGGPKKTFPTSM